MTRKLVAGGVLLFLLIAGIGTWQQLNQEFWPRGEALHAALAALREHGTPDQKMVANVVWQSYLEARTNASWWSGAYFGATFLAAIFSAAAGLILKLETLVRHEAIRKDAAAILAVSAAVLVTISTSGDFQRKWASNRTAAAQLESAGYELLESGGVQPLAVLSKVRMALHDRHAAIVGTPRAAASAGR